MLAGLSARHHLMLQALTVSWKRYLATVSGLHDPKVWQLATILVKMESQAIH